MEMRKVASSEAAAVNSERRRDVAEAPLLEPPDLCVVVPTFREKENVSELVHRVRSVLQGRAWELIFVDDSDDATPRVVTSTGLPQVRLVHRWPDERQGGLAGAVCTGFAAARGDCLAVMDGDLQHDPARLRDLAGALDHVDIAIASRFVDGGGGGAGLDGGYRETASHATRMTVRALFPRIRHVRDPLAGYFALRRSVLDGADLRPEGFKILLEILVKGRSTDVAEVPFALAPRADGVSKADLREGVRFGKHVLRLRLGR